MKKIELKNKMKQAKRRTGAFLKIRKSHEHDLKVKQDFLDHKENLRKTNMQKFLHQRNIHYQKMQSNKNSATLNNKSVRNEISSNYNSRLETIKEVERNKLKHKLRMKEAIRTFRAKKQEKEQTMRLQNEANSKQRFVSSMNENESTSKVPFLNNYWF